MARIELADALDLLGGVAKPCLGDRPLLVVLRKAFGRQVGDLIQLPRQVPCVRDDPLALAPDAIGVQIELVQPLFGERNDVCCITMSLITVILGFALGGADDLRGGVVGLREDVSDLVTDALQRVAHGRIRSLLLGLQLTDLALQLTHVGVDLIAVITPARGLEKALPAPGQLFAHRVKANRWRRGMKCGRRAPSQAHRQAADGPYDVSR